MVIKYKCFDHSKGEFRKLDMNNLVSMFVPNGTDDALRIVAPENFELLIWTGFADIHNVDIYPGDVLNDRVEVRWDILAGAWGLYERGSEKPIRFNQFGPREITDNVYTNPGWRDKQ